MISSTKAVSLKKESKLDKFLTPFRGESATHDVQVLVSDRPAWPVGEALKDVRAEVDVALTLEIRL